MSNQTSKFRPPMAVAKAASKGLKLRQKFNKGGTQVGLARANQLSKQQTISLSIIKRMASYFARHEVDKNAKDFSNTKNPSKGRIAWLLWGGEQGKNWANRLKKKYDV